MAGSRPSVLLRPQTEEEGIPSMRAIVFEEPGKVNLAEYPDPEPPAGWVRICIQAAAICMTDFELLRGRHPVEYPLTPGHEYCGVVDQVGSPVDEGWLGLKVVADNEITCLKCRYCRRGEWRRCPEYRQIGFGHSLGGVGSCRGPRAYRSLDQVAASGWIRHRD